MPKSSNHLGVRGVSKVEALEEGLHARGVGRFSCVSVSPLGSVAKEGNVS